MVDVGPNKFARTCTAAHGCRQCVVATTGEPQDPVGELWPARSVTGLLHV